MVELPYCYNRFVAHRFPTREVKVGSIGIGGNNPIRIQSMTTTNPENVAATIDETIKLAEAGCEIVRITAPNLSAAKALESIKKGLIAANCHVPLVADIHFLPQAAMEAALHVEKVRINPGNYADKKKFSQKEYSDMEYAAELERLHVAASPLILRCKELGRALRIGTNHGSLSDRIMNRYGDTPVGMVESALEFIRIAESHGFYNIVLSMKASNPKVMIEAYRLAAAKMREEGMNYPLHLGVTEAGDGEDGRIKSAIGIGTLLNDGLGDTIRVSLTEDPVYEIPVAQALAKRAHNLWESSKNISAPNITDSIDPFSYNRRLVSSISLNDNCTISDEAPPRVILHLPNALKDIPATVREISRLHNRYKDSRIEGLLIPIFSAEEVALFGQLATILAPSIPSFWAEVKEATLLSALKNLSSLDGACYGFVINPEAIDLEAFLSLAASHNALLALNTHAAFIEKHAALLRENAARLLFTTTQPENFYHPVGTLRHLAESLKTTSITSPLWLRVTSKNTLFPNEHHTSANLIESSLYLGNLLCDGLGDLISIELENSLEQNFVLSYNILQGTRNRFSKTEFVACPSCGRTLFDLQETTQKVRAHTGHLKGVTIAIMGCIVNGPGEIADADFGYVGGAPGKINLYVKKNCVEYNIPEENAVEKLIALIKSHNKWEEPS